MTETQKKELWQIAEVFRGTKGSGNINDVARIVLKEQLKNKIKPEYQNIEFIKNINFNWQSTAPDNSVEYVRGTFDIDADAFNVPNIVSEEDFTTIEAPQGLGETESVTSLNFEKVKERNLQLYLFDLNFANPVSYNDGRIIFFDVRVEPIINLNSVKFESNGGIRYFKDGAVNPITLAEQHIENYFSVARLLQMKVWWDAIPHESTPKLAAVYQWTALTTSSAIAGQTTFTEPPYTFDEITQEIASVG